LGGLHSIPEIDISNEQVRHLDFVFLVVGDDFGQIQQNGSALEFQLLTIFLGVAAELGLVPTTAVLL